MNSFDRIIGYETVKEELYQIIDMFRNSEMYEKAGAALPNGILLYGRPGMGKTMLANALIEECKAEAYLLKKHNDDTETLHEIESVFEKAGTKGKSIILIDDIDKFCEINEYDVDDKSFVAIQTGMDSVRNKNVLVIATANNPGRLPDSLRRNGRFDRKIRLLQPSGEDARKIIEFYMKDKCVDKNLNYDDVSKMISYTSCADLQTILNESAIYATYKRKDCIGMDDIVKAYLRDQYSSPDENFQTNDDEIAAVALHEAGHAVVAEIVKEGSVGFVSVQISGRDDVAGFTHLCEEIKKRRDDIMIGLGGKAAVELFLPGGCASGCQRDLQDVSNLIRGGISTNGVLGIGMLDVSDRDFSSSELFNHANESVVRAELERYLFAVKDIILKNRDFLFKLTEKLKEKHILLNSEIREIRRSVTVTPVTVQ